MHKGAKKNVKKQHFFMIFAKMSTLQNSKMAPFFSRCFWRISWKFGGRFLLKNTKFFFLIKIRIFKENQACFMSWQKQWNSNIFLFESQWIFVIKNAFISIWKFWICFKIESTWRNFISNITKLLRNAPQLSMMILAPLKRKRKCYSKKAPLLKIFFWRNTW